MGFIESRNIRAILSKTERILDLETVRTQGNEKVLRRNARMTYPNPIVQFRSDHSTILLTTSQCRSLDTECIWAIEDCCIGLRTHTHAKTMRASGQILEVLY